MKQNLLILLLREGNLKMIRFVLTLRASLNWLSLCLLSIPQIELFLLQYWKRNWMKYQIQCVILLQVQGSWFVVSMTATEHNFQIFQFWTLDLYSCDHGTQYPHRRDQCFKHADRHGSVHLVWVAAVPAYIITLKAVSRRHPYCVWESSHRK